MFFGFLDNENHLLRFRLLIAIITTYRAHINGINFKSTSPVPKKKDHNNLLTDRQNKMILKEFRDPKYYMRFFAMVRVSLK